MAKKARRPQAPKQRNWVAKTVRDLDGPYRPKQFKDKTKSGLYDAKSRLMDLNNVGVYEFGTKEIVRNPIIGKILKRYD